MKFLVPNCSCFQNTILFVLCPQLNLLNPPSLPNKIPGYATDVVQRGNPFYL